MSQWPHSPSHIFNEKGSYLVTAATAYKQHLFKNSSQLDLLQINLFELSQKYGWKLEAWAIFANHYHFIAQSPTDPTSLRKLITHLHAQTAILLNSMENSPGRQVWFQYWDTHLTYEKSYLARLNYVMNNPVRHGLVQKAKEYRWCSKSWFSSNATLAHQKVVASFKTDMVNIQDDD
jgi:putative transposase